MQGLDCQVAEASWQETPLALAWKCCKDSAMEPENADDVVPRPKHRAGGKRLHWPTTPTGMSLVGFSQVGLFVIVLFYVLHEMKPVLLPLVLAILVSLIVHPVYMAFRALRLPHLLSATATVCALIAVILFGAYQAFLPGAEWAQNVDQEKLLGKVQQVFRPMKQVQAEIKEVAQKVQNATKQTPEPVTEENKVIGKSGDGSSPETEDGELEGKAVPPVEFKPVAEAPFLDDPEEKVEKKAEEPAPVGAPVMVEIHEDPFAMLLMEMRDFGVGLVAFLLLVLFILAYGNRITHQLGENETTALILARMGKDVSRYMFTITIINAGLGLFIGVAMWGLGMPRPALWGVMAMILNFIPYLGAFTGTFVVFLASAVNFESPGMVLAVPLVYFSLTAIEGNLVTPTVLGGKFRINPLVVFIWIFAWAGFWGVAGMLIAMPALVIFKIICENTQKMEKFRKIFSA